MARIGWSQSRVRTLSTCERKYYIRYYHSYLSEEDSQKVKELINLKTMANWVGTIIHDEISFLLSHVIEKDVNLIWKERKELIKNHIYSNPPFQPANSQQRQIKLLEESHKEVKPYDKHTLYEAVVLRIQSFIDSPLFELIFSGMKEFKNYYVEPQGDFFEKMKFNSQEFEGIDMWMKPDFWVQYEKDKYLLLDWKSGHIHDNGITPQLKAYAYRMVCENNLDLNHQTLEAYSIYLPDVKMVGGIITPQMILDVTSDISRDVEHMQSFMFDLGNYQWIPKDIDLFKKIENKRYCDSCNFLDICNKYN